MKKVFIGIVIMILSAAYSQAQMTFKETAKATKEVKEVQLTISGKVFTCEVSGSGCYYLPRVSKNSKEYKQYLGYKTAYKHEGKEVFSDKKETKYWYWKLGKTGWPSKVVLESN